MKVNYYDLTHPQKRIWYVEKVNNRSPVNIIGGLMRIYGKIDVHMLIEAIKTVIKGSDSIRMRFTELEGKPVQYVCEYDEEDIEFIDFSGFDDEKGHFETWYTSTMSTLFQLLNAKLYRFYVYKLNTDEYGFLLRIHHLIADGWSTGIIEKQVILAYESFMQGNTSHKADIYPYINYINKEKSYLESQQFEENKLFWNEKFCELPEIIKSSRNSSTEGNRIKYRLPEDLCKQLKEKLSKDKLSLSTFFITLNMLYISKTRSIDDVVIGIPVLNRTGVQEKNTIGMFTSTMPFRVRIDKNLKVKELFYIINSELKKCLRNQRYPYDVLVKDIELRMKGLDNLFDTTVNCYITKYNNMINGISTSIEQIYSGVQNYPFQIVVEEVEDKGEINLYFDYKLCEYSVDDIVLMKDYITSIIESIIENDEVLIKDFSIEKAKVIEKQVKRFNDTFEAYPKQLTVVDLFDDQALKNPLKIAAIESNRKISYLQLMQNINRRANYFEKCGLKAGEFVTIISTHSIELVETIFAVLKTGAVYVPIDPSYPKERIEYILKDLSASFLYTDNSDEYSGYSGTIIYEKDINLSGSSTEYNNKSKPQELAYIIYTSGSTGKPKGVMVEHAGLVNYVTWAGRQYLKGEEELFAFYSSISFDLTITSIFAPLICGKTIDIYPDSGNEFVLYRIFRKNTSTVIKMTPSHLSLIKNLDNTNSSIKRIIVGGENLSVKLALEASESFAHSVEIINEYGPTETVVGCMIHRFNYNLDKVNSVPIGKPTANVEVFLLDRDNHIVPIGCTGEIYISGDGISRGYLNQPELTKNSFITFEDGYLRGHRVYKTGDLAKWLPDGNMEFVGRVDDQVKIRGYRIELNEIRNVLLNIEGIDNAVVKDISDERGNKVLCAYIISKKKYDDREIKIQLMTKIPRYMIPAHYIYINEIPLTSSGKVNYRKLPKVSVQENEYVGADSEIGRTFINVLKEVLNVEQISMNDNYFYLGGDSIKAILICAKMKDIGFYISVGDIIQCDTIKETVSLAKEIQACNQENVEGNIIRTPIIDWFFEQNFRNPNYYNQSVLIEIVQQIDADNLELILNQLVLYHDALRINYDVENNKLFYNEELLESSNKVCYYDFSSYSTDELDTKIVDVGINLKRSFNIEKGFMLKGAVIKVSQEKSFILLTVHHLVIDGVSWRILLEDFCKLLDGITSNKVVKLPAKTSSFKAWASMLSSYSKNVAFDKESNYWEQINNYYDAYPVDYSHDNSDYRKAAVIYSEINEVITRDLPKLAMNHFKLNMEEVLIAALAFAINNVTGLEKFPLVLEYHGRKDFGNSIDISRTIGWFTTMNPVLLEVLKANMKTNLKNLKEILRSIPDKGFNYLIYRYIYNKTGIKLNKLVRFNFLGDFDNVLYSDLCKISDKYTGPDVDECNELTVLIDINILIIKNRITVSFSYCSNKFKHENIKKLMNEFCGQIEEIYNYLCRCDDIEFTPSDFDSTYISQDEIDTLLT